MYIAQISVVFNWRKEQNSYGKYSARLRITLNRLSTYYTIQTPEKAREDQWVGSGDSWVKNSHPYAFEINNKLQEKNGYL
jgi:hypothetical protein